VFAQDLRSEGGVDLLHGPSVRALVESVRPTHVVHAAGGHGRQEPRELFLLHAVTTAHLLQELAAASPQAVFLNVGSSSQYGAQDPAREPLLEETHLDRPSSVYAVSKAAQENLVAASAAEGRIGAIYIRLFNPIGAGQSGPFLVPRLLEQLEAATDGCARFRLANLEAVRDFVDVRDAAHALVLALRSPSALGQRLNVCSGNGTSVRELATIFGRTRGLVAEFDALPSTGGEIAYQRGSNERLRQTTGWQPAYSLEATVAWISGHRA
jgi:nucleoside-diphosphate-sugar epimerase